VDIDVKNTGEPAFLAQVKFELPAFAPIVRVPKNCIEGRGPSANMLTCDIGNPLPTSSKVRKSQITQTFIYAPPAAERKALSGSLKEYATCSTRALASLPNLTSLMIFRPAFLWSWTLRTLRLAQKACTF
jgi:Integrin alpha